MNYVSLHPLLTADQWFTPLAKEPYSFFLDSSQGGRYSFLGAYPYKIARTLLEVEEELNSLSALDIIVPSALGEIPFLGGAVGFLSYDAVREWKPHLGSSKKEPFQIPNICFGFYDTFFVIDHAQKKTFLISLELTPQSKEIFEIFKDIECSSDTLSNFPAGNLRCRSGSLSCFARTMPAHPARASSEHSMSSKIASNLSFKSYCSMIKKAQHYIEQGEIYQVNLSQCFSAPLQQDPFLIYQKLRTLNPAPFSAYFNFGGGEILCSSPERFISVTQEGLIQTEPIKGTVKRGKTEKEDQKFKTFLLESEKNRAELMMIVDLERNDLGKICQFGSIHVPTLYELRTYATVHHLVSVIRGKLKTNSFSEIIKATFPGGSITGAPKLRAMQIIDELEPHNRGIYTGSIGYIDYRRQIDLNIAIRTLIHQNGNFYFPMGGGIVCDSTPLNEYEETFHKGQALISAVS